MTNVLVCKHKIVSSLPHLTALLAEIPDTANDHRLHHNQAYVSSTQKKCVIPSSTSINTRATSGKNQIWNVRDNKWPWLVSANILPQKIGTCLCIQIQMIGNHRFLPQLHEQATQSSVYVTPVIVTTSIKRKKEISFKGRLSFYFEFRI